MHDLETEQDQDISPKQAAWELDYYTVETATGPSDAIKRHCREAKRSPPQRCRDIDAGNFPPSDATRGATASFMAMQFARGTTTRIVTADR